MLYSVLVNHGKARKVARQHSRDMAASFILKLPASAGLIKMEPAKKPNPASPYYQPESSVTVFKMRLIQHLEMLRMPTTKPGHEHEQDCQRDCHIMERNHTIEVIKHFVSNVEGVDN